MLNRIRNLLRIWHLRKAIPLWDAARLLWRGSQHGEAYAVLKITGTNIALRPKTSDIDCLEKVFVTEEYCSPISLEPQCIIDAGANIGMATLYFTSQYPKAHIIAIEPDPENFRLLTLNCGALPNVTLVQAALWSKHQEQVTLSNPLDQHWAVRVSLPDSHDELGSPVKTVSVPAMIEQLGFGKVDLLKLDIEGAEKALFTEGSADWLDKTGLIITELHDRFVEGCSESFYQAITPYHFRQEIVGENIFVQLGPRRA